MQRNAFNNHDPPMMISQQKV
jgi:hypothetical protein